MSGLKISLVLLNLGLMVSEFSLVYCENQKTDYLQALRSCLSLNGTIVCLKEEVLNWINRTIYSDEVMDFGAFQVGKDNNFHSKITEEDLPKDSSRNLVLTDVIYDKIEEFFNSRIVKFKLGDAVEARKKGGGIGGYKGGYGGGKKGGGLLILVGMAMAGMMTQLFMGKIAFMAGAALLLAKMALVMSTVATFKKSSGEGGGKETAHVIYASPETHGGGQGYGGYGGYGGSYGNSWHRSLNPEDYQQNTYYPGLPQTTTNTNMVQYQTRRKRR